MASPAGKVYRYLPHAENTKLSAKDVGSRLENHLVPRFGRLVMGDITTQQVQQFLVGAQGRAVPGHRAVQWEAAPRNPVHGVPKFQENNQAAV